MPLPQAELRVVTPFISIQNLDTNIDHLLIHSNSVHLLHPIIFELSYPSLADGFHPIPAPLGTTVRVPVLSPRQWPSGAQS
jgi:hypothetical protein